MNITDKIEEIRRKPEHERVRYVWAMVSLSMIFVIFIWFFSFKNMLGSDNKTNSESGPITGLEQESLDDNNSNEGKSDIN
ncbi:MAG: hypothetical protein UR60_C0007G0010 [Candidatus Moranbacteria bacterium GW2011_GWF2_34_56]|nr:MAG: hypothetical protein UR51_C0001G0010 [Candidatus Moranbacteria bacterium GW2011_GWF1_34_10]KKP65160.1 MAG: hypothetical protein UR60_C0007G0010 [Candidatus Moranbacteria bacterium GW2011_GWF2_34_56]HBI17386.1 hypothetical protein [Candidatus Moranbacteria bacterium]